MHRDLKFTMKHASVCNPTILKCILLPALQREQNKTALWRVGPSSGRELILRNAVHERERRRKGLGALRILDLKILASRHQFSWILCWRFAFSMGLSSLTTCSCSAWSAASAGSTEAVFHVRLPTGHERVPGPLPRNFSSLYTSTHSLCPSSQRSSRRRQLADSAAGAK